MMMSDEQQSGAPAATPQSGAPKKSYEEFEVGHHPVPWFLWLFFILIITWASISWIPFFGY